MVENEVLHTVPCIYESTPLSKMRGGRKPLQVAVLERNWWVCRLHQVRVHALHTVLSECSVWSAHPIQKHSRPTWTRQNSSLPGLPCTLRLTTLFTLRSSRATIWRISLEKGVDSLVCWLVCSSWAFWHFWTLLTSTPSAELKTRHKKKCHLSWKM